MLKKRIAILAMVCVCGLASVLLAKPEKSAVRKQAVGNIDSLDPVGTGTAGQVAFTARASFAGVGIGPTAEMHTITLRLLVIDEDGTIVGNTSQDYEVANAENGCIKCPLTITKSVNAGAYFLNATLSDVGPDGKKVRMDVKSGAVILN